MPQGFIFEKSNKNAVPSRRQVHEISTDFKLISRLMVKLDQEVASFSSSMRNVNNDVTEIVGLTKLWDEQARMIEHQLGIRHSDSGASCNLASEEQQSNREPIILFTIQSVDDKIESFQKCTDELNFI